MTYRLRRRDGVFRWIMDVGVPHFNHHRELAGYIGTCMDITDHKTALVNESSGTAIANIPPRRVDTVIDDLGWRPRDAGAAACALADAHSRFVAASVPPMERSGVQALPKLSHPVIPRDRGSVHASALVHKVEDSLEVRELGSTRIFGASAAFDVSLRTVQRAFLRTIGAGPARYLRSRRLAAARLKLLLGDPLVTNVTSIAIEEGFWELGRFAVEYRQMFGEKPSETLRRRVAS
jgi:AraC-like DNA-binding protein